MESPVCCLVGLLRGPLGLSTDLPLSRCGSFGSLLTSAVAVFSRDSSIKNLVAPLIIIPHLSSSEAI